MRKTRVTIAMAALAASAGAGWAQAPFSWPPSLVVVPAGQTSRIGITTNLDIACHFLGYVSVDVVQPPAAGQVLTQRRPAEYPTYPADSPRAKCDAQRRPATVILYRPQPGFTGTDRFVMRILDQNHSPALKPYTVQVQ